MINYISLAKIEIIANSHVYYLGFGILDLI